MKRRESMARFLRHGACDKCGSSDAVAVYDDEAPNKCMSCGHLHKVTDDFERERNKMNTQFNVVDLPHGTIEDRKISKAVCEKFNVVKSVDADGSTDKVYYSYYKDKTLLGYKVRGLPKSFTIAGTLGDELFGQHAFTPGGKRLVITEGEEDALAVAECSKQQYNLIYPVVSIASANNLRAVVEQREWIRSFEEVVLFTDRDPAGKAAVEKLASIIGYDKVKVATANNKDASEDYTLLGKKHVMESIWNAQVYNPQFILTSNDLWKSLEEYNNIKSNPYPDCFSELNDKLKGMRFGEITLWTSGTGAGKSTLLREVMLDIVSNTDEKIGIISLEESPAETARKLAGMALNRNPAKEDIPMKELKEGFDKVFGDDRVLVLDHAGSMSDGIVNQLEYMALRGCKYLFIDHITILVSEGAEGLTGNEAIDKIMNDLLRITKQHNVWIGLVSHLRKMQQTGKSFEEGHMPTVDDIRGSGSIKQISHDIIAFARDISSEDESARNTISLKVLKSRFTGDTGPAGKVKYNSDTGRLDPVGSEVTF
jgi:twinkle protein